MHNFLKKYIDKLNINDIKSFANKNNINLSKEELELIFKYIKNDWEIIIYKNPSKIFNELEKKLSKENYNILISLFNEYKNKFKNFL